MLKSKARIRNISILVFAVLLLGISLKLLIFKGITQKLIADCNSERECKDEPVVVLHGLVRSAASMSKISRAVNNSGYTVCNIQYPSRKHSIEKLAADFVYVEIEQCLGNTQQPINFVTHSMGGIIVRQLGKSTNLKINRVVMLSPPNHGSELVDKLKIIPLFKLINGEAGLSLNTAPDSIANTLGKVNFTAGIITGNKSFNPIYSYLIPGEDDGKVGVASAKVAGMKDFLIVPYSHSFIMNNDSVIKQTIEFIDRGEFS